MLDADWRITYPGVDYTWGAYARPVYNETTPDLGDYEVRTADVQVPRGDGMIPGVDYFGARTIGFTAAVHTDSETATRAAVDEFALSWRGDSIRGRGGALATLTSRFRGQERVVIGRPRRFAPGWAGIHTGFTAQVTCDFACVDEKFYDATDTVQTTPIIATPVGGFTSPLVSPIVAASAGTQATRVTIGGSLPTWPVVEITGPISNPSVDIVGGPKFSLAVSVAYDEVLTVDTRPWSRSVRVENVNDRTGGRSATGTLTRTSTRLGDATVSPGVHAVIFRGVSPTNTATLTLRWRSAWATP